MDRFERIEEIINDLQYAGELIEKNLPEMSKMAARSNDFDPSEALDAVTELRLSVRFELKEMKDRIEKRKWEKEQVVPESIRKTEELGESLRKGFEAPAPWTKVQLNEETDNYVPRPDDRPRPKKSITENAE